MVLSKALNIIMGAQPLPTNPTAGIIRLQGTGNPATEGVGRAGLERAEDRLISATAVAVREDAGMLEPGRSQPSRLPENSAGSNLEYPRRQSVVRIGSAAGCGALPSSLQAHQLIKHKYTAATPAPPNLAR